MATLSIRCQCGEQFHADEGTIGRRIRCRRCGAEVEVARPARTADPAPAPPPARDSADGNKSRKRRKKRSHHEGTTGSSRRPLIIIRRSRTAKVIAVLAWSYLGIALLVAALMWGFGDRNALGTV